ncbi:hypothetical protein BJ741DRAFT_2349 [Chytriomyces cf. hyalinus JEL632]|nr:hypothetical protein BJ741DRAFT_2349 [Chytriomyces cf. hyalinus JEL632]
MHDAENASEIAVQEAAIELESIRTLRWSLKSTERAISKLEDIHTNAAESLFTLAQQSEKIQIISDSIERIKESSTVAEVKVRQLQGLKGWMPRFHLKIPTRLLRKKRSKCPPELPCPDGPLQDIPHIPTECDMLHISNTKLMALSGALKSTGSFQVSSTATQQQQQQLRAQEMFTNTAVSDVDVIAQQVDGNLDRISSSLQMLRVASLAMGQEIDAQTERLSGLSIAVESADGKVARVHGKLSQAFS